ncbi:response regulator [Cytobacillus sp. FJAT-54145]|uniref:Response regulator n=1 Tax=Cytobacillus spartinae TaxID=3299023 RepID=A0ABW6KEY1_9BACI
MEKIKLLLVDDQDLIRESLKIVLEMEEDFELVGVASNGQEAYDQAIKMRPDIILMDLNMPVMDGITATKLIKQSYSDVKIIILTTFQEVDYVKDALKNGAEAYLLKAIHPNDLASSIRLVNRGETLISQVLARQLLSSIPDEKAEETLNKKYGLSEREGDILKSIANGLSNKEISEKYYLTEGTVKNYVSRLYAKLDVTNRLDAINKIKGEK